jgi:F0F1-type ATP synthase gamma subunit
MMEETTSIRQKLHQFIDAVEDKKLAVIYTIFKNEIDVDAQRRQLIQNERNNYLKEEGVSYSWVEVKDMALNKSKRKRCKLALHI